MKFKYLVSFIFAFSFSLYATAEKPVVISCGVVGKEFRLCKEGVARWEKLRGKKAKVIPAPNGSNERLTIYQQQFAAESDDIDIYQMDIVWPGLLANHLEDLTPYIAQEEISKYLSNVISNNTVGGKLVMLPWFINIGFLYYRKDLLEKYGFEPPETWEDLEKIAQTIQQEERKIGHKKLWGYCFQGKAYEGLTCNALEFIDSYKGGNIVEKDGTISINNERAAVALRRLSSWIGNIVPTGALNYEQEDCRGIFQSGNLIFMRNWAYAWPLLNQEGSPVAGKVGIIPLPKGGTDGKHTGIIGAWNLGVSIYSKRKKDAVDLLLFLTSEEELKRRALEGGYFPTRTSLYEDPEVIAISPIVEIMVQMLPEALARPASQSGKKYNQVSSIFWNAVHSVLGNKSSPEKALSHAEKKLKFISRNGKNWHK